MVSQHTILTFLIGLVLLANCSALSRWRRVDNEHFPQGAGPKKPGRLDQSEEAGGGGGDAGAMSEDVIIQDFQPTGQNTTEQGMPPKYPLNVVSAEASAHDNEVAGCRDHTNASMICAKARNPCFCEEHETYMYSYCRRSCKYCNPETRTYHRYWRLRAASDFNPTWMVAEIEMYTQRGENTSLTLNGTSAYASSEYDGFPPRNAFDRSMFTNWMPAGWIDHSQMDEWIAYEFPIPVNVKSVRLASNPQYPRSTPSKITVEASDYRDGPFVQKWKIRNPDYATDRIYNFIECPVLWRRLDAEFQTYCFRLITKYKTWPEARKECQEEGGELASVTSDEELRFILQDVRVCGFVWIGLNDRRREGFYEWADGRNATYTRWPKGLYYDEYQRHFEDCTAMDPDGNWFTFVCQNKFHFICRKTLSEPKPPMPEEAPASEESPIIFLAPNYTLPVAARIHPNPAAKDESEREAYAELLTDVAVQQMKEKGFKPPMALANMINPPADMSQKLVQITAQAEQKLKQMHEKFEKQQEEEKQNLKEHYHKQDLLHKQIHKIKPAPSDDEEADTQGENENIQEESQEQEPVQPQLQTQPNMQQAPSGENEEPPRPQPNRPPIAPNPAQPTIAQQQEGQGGINGQSLPPSPIKDNSKHASGKVIGITKISKRPPTQPHKPHGPPSSPHSSPDFAAGQMPPPPIKGKNEKTISETKVSLKPPVKAPKIPPSRQAKRPQVVSLPIPPPSPPNEGDEPQVTAPPIGESGDEGSADTDIRPSNNLAKDQERHQQQMITIGPINNSQEDDAESIDQNTRPPQTDEAPDTPDELRSPNEQDEADSEEPNYLLKKNQTHKRHNAAKAKENVGKDATKRHNPKSLKETAKKSTHQGKAKVARPKVESLFKKGEDDFDDEPEFEDETSSGSATDDVESRRIAPDLEGIIRALI